MSSYATNPEQGIETGTQASFGGYTFFAPVESLNIFPASQIQKQNLWSTGL